MPAVARPSACFLGLPAVDAFRVGNRAFVRIARFRGYLALMHAPSIVGIASARHAPARERPRAPLAALFLTTAFAVAGCGGPAPDAAVEPSAASQAPQSAPSDAPNRFTFDRFQFELPAEFVAVDFGALDREGALAKATAKLEPEQRQGFTQIFRDVAAANEVRLLGFDGDAIDIVAESGETEGVYVDCVNIIVDTMPVAASRPAVVKANLDTLRKMGIVVRSQSEFVTTPAGPTGPRLAFDSFTYDMPQYGAKMVGYILVHERQFMVLTFGAAPQRFDGFRRKSEAILRTIVPR